MKWFRLPRDIVFAFVTAVRFVPVLMMDALQIMDAQKSRGLELQKGNIFSRFKRFIPILIPLIVDAVLRSGDLAEAMESRAYGAVKKPTSLHKLEMGLLGKVVSISSIALIVPISYLFLFWM
jgi:energy-coupling factor transport system permease protein